MTDTVKLIIEIPKKVFEARKIGEISPWVTVPILDAVQKGTPLDSNSEKAEVQAYFAGEAYGWEQGRKALIDDVKAEIKTFTIAEKSKYDRGFNEAVLKCFNALDNIGNAENKDPNDMTRMFEGVTEIPKDAFKGWYTEKMLEQTRAESEEV